MSQCQGACPSERSLSEFIPYDTGLSWSVSRLPAQLTHIRYDDLRANSLAPQHLIRSWPSTRMSSRKRLPLKPSDSGHGEGRWKRSRPTERYEETRSQPQRSFAAATRQTYGQWTSKSRREAFPQLGTLIGHLLLSHDAGTGYAGHFNANPGATIRITETRFHHSTQTYI